MNNTERAIGKNSEQQKEDGIAKLMDTTYVTASS